MNRHRDSYGMASERRRRAFGRTPDDDRRRLGPRCACPADAGVTGRQATEPGGLPLFCVVEIGTRGCGLGLRIVFRRPVPEVGHPRDFELTVAVAA